MAITTQALPKATAQLIGMIKDLPDIKHFYLSGGAALSLQLGHRESEDLDFFNKKNFNPQGLQEKLRHFGELQNVAIAEGTLNLFLQGVKLQFLYYPYHLLEHFIVWNGIYLSSVIDIACTKLITISARGGKKDFIDLYFILQCISLQKLLQKLDEKYSDVSYNYPHILKSLVYFDDAETQPMPRMHTKADWEEVKKTIIEKVKEYKF